MYDTTKQQLIKILLLFLTSFLFLFWLQNSQTFADPDSFYHAKIIWLMSDKIITGQVPIFDEFPWLYHTVLKTGYIDHHFLYHLLSVPLFLIIKTLFQQLPFLGQSTLSENYQVLLSFKLITVFWGALFISLFYFILKKLKIKGVIFFTVLLLITHPLLFRLSLGKASAASLIFALLGIYWCRTKRYWPLFFLSFFYVWLYGGWPILLIIVVSLIVAESLTKFLSSQQKKSWRLLLSQIFSSNHYKLNLTAHWNNYLTSLNFTTPNPSCEEGKRRGLLPLLARQWLGVVRFPLILKFLYNKLILTVVGGLTAGIIINPYFPKNLIFYYHQIYHIAIVNYKETLNVGGEWYNYNFFDLLTNASLLFLLLIPTLIFFIGQLFYFVKTQTAKRRLTPTKQSITNLLFTFILATIFLILTIKSRRYVEYAIPLLILFIAETFNLIIYNFWSQKVKIKIYHQLIKTWYISGVVLGFFAIALPYIIWRDLTVTRKELINGFAWNSWRDASQWLKNYTKPGEVVVNNDWDDWPFLFFYNDRNYYVAGLDPTFMYKFDAQLYQQWSDLTLGKNTIPLIKILANLQSQYILIDKQHTALEQQVLTDGHFVKVFDNKETKIYKLSLMTH